MLTFKTLHLIQRINLNQNRNNNNNYSIPRHEVKSNPRKNGSYNTTTQRNSTKSPTNGTDLQSRQAKKSSYNTQHTFASIFGVLISLFHIQDQASHHSRKTNRK